MDTLALDICQLERNYYLCPSWLLAGWLGQDSGQLHYKSSKLYSESCLLEEPDCTGVIRLHDYLITLLPKTTRHHSHRRYDILVQSSQFCSISLMTLSLTSNQPGPFRADMRCLTVRLLVELGLNHSERMACITLLRDLSFHSSSPSRAWKYQ